MEIKVTLDASPALLAALQAIAGSLTAKPAAPAPKEAAPKKAVTPKPAPADMPLEIVATEPEPKQTEPVNNAHTIDELRALAVPKSKAGKKDDIKAWLTDHNFNSLADLAPTHFEAFHKFITHL